MEVIQKPHFFAYCRESVDLESGIEIQKEKIKKYCEYKGIIVDKWFIDNDRSAYKYRPNYDKMFKILPGSQVNGIICTHLFRFGRNTSELLKRRDDLKKLGKDIIFTEHQIDTSTTAGKAMFGMMAVFGDFERETLRERLLAGREYAKIHGTKSGKPMHRPSKNINVKIFDEMKDKGLSVPSIAKVLGVSKSKLYIWIKNERTIPKRHQRNE